MMTIIQQRAHKYALKEFYKLKKNLGLDQEMNSYYFGYGANLSIERFKKWHIPAEVVGTAFIENHQLKFNLPCEYKGKGFAGLEECSGRKIWGVLFKVNSNALKLLDVLEWVPFNFYERKLFEVVSQNVTYPNVHLYVTCHPKSGLIPSKGYLDFIVQSGIKANFPEDYIAELVSSQTSDKFELDTSFDLRDPSRKRFCSDKLSKVYLIHDQLREKLTRLIP